LNPQLFNRDWLKVREKEERSLLYTLNPNCSSLKSHQHKHCFASTRRVSPPRGPASPRSCGRAEVPTWTGFYHPRGLVKTRLWAKPRPWDNCGRARTSRRRTRTSRRNGHPDGIFYRRSSVLTYLLYGSFSFFGKLYKLMNVLGNF
jgi:hypothetical protein